MYSRILINNNPYVACIYSADIDLISGKAFYKSNVDRYDCFFIVPQKRLLEFKSSISYINFSEWHDKYCILNNTHEISLDGYSWSIKLFSNDLLIEQLDGYNTKPDNFDMLIDSVEMLLNKDFK